MPNQKLDAITLNLCPDCGNPPELFVYPSGYADCRCSNYDCLLLHDMEKAPSWQIAIARWNENTAKAYAERPESPISTSSDSEPADVENRPQDGSECDTREKLLDNIWREITTTLSNNGRLHDPNFWYANIVWWLDRQDAITQREFAKEQEESTLNVMRIDDELRKQISELTAERDRLADERYRYKLQCERWESKIAMLEAERDDLRSRLKTQAYSFQKLERDNAKLRDTLARVRGLVGDAE